MPDARAPAAAVPIGGVYAPPLIEPFTEAAWRSGLHAAAKTPPVTENHPDCPADKPFGVPGPDGKITCHATRKQAQDLALTLDFGPDVTPATPGAAMQVGAAKGGTGGNADPAERMRIYWSHGEGAAKVAWGTPGDFDRCVMHVSKFMANPQGYCAERHHDALGIWPATHAKLVREGGGNVAPKGSALDDALAAWDPSAHPRAPAGGSTGGQFAPGAGGAAPTNAAPVQQGQSGEQVRQLQVRLNALGAKPRLAVDGKFGPLTLAAVRDFQKTHKDAAGKPLKVDGLVGPLTTSALRLKTPAKAPAKGKAGSSRHRKSGGTAKPSGTTSRKTTTTKPSSGGTSKTSTSKSTSKSTSRPGPATTKAIPATAAGKTPMSTGSHGAAVSSAQRKLNAAGAKLPVSGTYDARTAAAVRAFQRTHKDAQGKPLKADGIIGPKTWAALTYATTKGTHGKQSAVTYAGAALRPGDDVMAFQWSHGWKWLGGGGAPGKGRRRRVHEPLIPEGGEGVPLEPRRRKVADLTYRPAKPAPPLRHPLIPTGLSTDEPRHEVTRPGGAKPGQPAEKRPGRLTRMIQGPSKGRSIFEDARGGMAGRGGLGAHAENLSRRLEAVTRGGDAIVPMSAGERKAARTALRAAPHPDAKALAGRIRPGAGDVPLSAYERGILADALTLALTGEAPRRRPARNWGAPEVSPAYAAALITAKRGSGRYKHGWIKIGSGAADDLDRGMNPGAARQVKHHLDKAHDAARAGDHDQAAEHLGAALDTATHDPGATSRLTTVIREAHTGQRGKAIAQRNARRAKPSIPGAGHHVSRREAEGLAQMFGPGGGGKARPRQGYTSGPFGRHLSKRDARGFANLFGASAADGAPPGEAPGEAPGAVPPGPPGLPSLVTIPGVDLLAAGTWHLSSGRQTFTRADLEHAADAAKCPAVGPPVIKIGHLDPRFKPAPEHDGEPAIGRVLNIKLNEAGTKLTGDLAGMPGWLGAIAASAFPRRSVEGKFRFRCQIGHTHDFVLTGLALLGVTPPGVGVLGNLTDIAALYGVDPSTTAAAAQAGTWRTEPTEPTGAVMAVTEEDVRRAYYASAGAPTTWWITELQMNPQQLIVADEDTGKLYRVPYQIDAEAVTFEAAAEIASYSEVAAARGTGPVVVYASAEESRSFDVEAASVSNAPWSNFTKADYSPAQWHAACLIHDHGSGVPDTKDQCKLPVKEPSGTLNRNGVHAAAGALGGARGGVQASSEQKAKAASSLRGLYGTLNEDPPDSLKAAAGEPGPGDLGARLDRLYRISGAAADAVTAAAADADEDVKQLVASLDATLDQASQLSAGIDRSTLDADAGQALDLITAAEAIADQLMDKLGIYDPDDADADEGSGGTSAAADTGEAGDGNPDVAAGDGPPGPMHGVTTAEHSHPHAAGGSQGSDATHEHVHKHANDADHNHAHDTHAAAQAASTENGGGPDMGFDFTSTQMAAIRRRLGKTHGEPITAADIAAAMDTPRAPTVAAAAGGAEAEEVSVPNIADGTYLVDSEILKGYQERAVAGDRAVLAMHLAERDTILAAAVDHGKFAQSRREHFEKLWDKDPEGTRKLVASLAPGLIPMGGPLGSAGEFTGDPDFPGDFEAQRAYFDLYPEDRKGGITPAPGVRGSRG